MLSIFGRKVRIVKVILHIHYLTGYLRLVTLVINDHLYQYIFICIFHSSDISWFYEETSHQFLKQISLNHYSKTFHFNDIAEWDVGAGLLKTMSCVTSNVILLSNKEKFINIFDFNEKCWRKKICSTNQIVRFPMYRGAKSTV